MSNPKTGILLINLGSPDSYSVSDIRRFLKEFLSDPRVLDMNSFSRFLLLNFLILPFRPKKIAPHYKEVWTTKGSPLVVISTELKDLLQKNLGEDYQVELAMSYGYPGIEITLEKFHKQDYSKLIILPLFPHYASATVGSIHTNVMKSVSKWEVIPDMHFISSFYSDEKYLNVLNNFYKKYKTKTYDLVLFSFHGLPIRQIEKADTEKRCLTHADCCARIHSGNQYCYRAQCFEQVRQLVKLFGLSPEKYMISFQSRFGKSPWLEPYTEDLIHKLPSKGIKKILVLCPSFTVDCVETTFEVASEYRDEFLKNNGEVFDVMESMNTEPLWIDALGNMIREFNCSKVL